MRDDLLGWLIVLGVIFVMMVLPLIGVVFFNWPMRTEDAIFP